MERLELEILKLKETEGFKQNYPHLYEQKFGIGTKTNIIMIAKKIKGGLFAEHPDLDWVLHQVLDECREKVSVKIKPNKSFSWDGHMYEFRF